MKVAEERGEREREREREAALKCKTSPPILRTLCSRAGVNKGNERESLDELVSVSHQSVRPGEAPPVGY